MAMIFIVENTSDGYVVSYHNPIDCRWHPLRNFGDRQGDAIDFKTYDCPKLSLTQISLLVSNYAPERKYKRISSRRFEVQDNE